MTGGADDAGAVAAGRAGRRGGGRLVRLAGALALAAVLAWGAGLAWFVRGALQPGEAPPDADGIVALTGGAERIELALRLLAEGRARLLLVSGVAPGAELGELARRAGVDPGPLAARVTLGRQARSTLGNAAETAAWARANGVRSLIVVTAGYHMPRALAEIGWALPEATLHPDAVLPPAMRAHGAGALRLLAWEYTKWLLVRSGLARQSI
ncbi:MAG: YdcF family protein [Janthinobacterium lividum]